MTAKSYWASVKKFAFHSFFSILLELTIVVAAILWVTYGYLPHQYYLPVSFLSIAIVGFVSFFVLNKRLEL